MMKRQGVRIVLLGCLLMIGAAATTVQAVPLARTITITIKMDNDKCAQRIATSLREVPNVGDVRADIQRQVATVSPSGLRLPSARALWEAVEKTGHEVVQLQGPQGKFTSKPEN